MSILRTGGEVEMKTEEMICELRRLEEIHKNDFVSTFETNWSLMCHDVANRLEELLAAQKPRSISRKEWDEWRHIPDGKREPLYVQDSTVGWWILNPSNWLEIAFLTGEIKIWNKRPTNEQREATPWN